MKKAYQTIEAILIILESADIITLSGLDDITLEPDIEEGDD